MSRKPANLQPSQVLEPQAARFLLKLSAAPDTLPAPAALSAAILAAARATDASVPAPLLLACLAVRQRALAANARAAIADTAKELGVDEKAAVSRCVR